jgi:hypothetical protein
MILHPASSPDRLIAMLRNRRSASAGLSDRHEPESVIVFTGIRKQIICIGKLVRYKDNHQL